MNKYEEWFQKRLALYSALGTMFVAAVTMLITLGLTWTQFNLVPPMDNSQIDNSTTAIHTFIKSVNEAGNKFVWYGIELLIAGIIAFPLAILTDTSKSKSKFGRFSKIDLDEMNEEKDVELEKLQESLKNTTLQLQIAELKLQITELKNEVETEKLNQVKAKGRRKTRKSKK